MTTRKKRGVGYFISGAAFIVGGAICFAAQVTPVWFPAAISLVGLVAGFFGFKFVYPDED